MIAEVVLSNKPTFQSTFSYPVFKTPASAKQLEIGRKLSFIAIFPVCPNVVGFATGVKILDFNHCSYQSDVKAYPQQRSTKGRSH